MNNADQISFGQTSLKKPNPLAVGPIVVMAIAVGCLGIYIFYQAIVIRQLARAEQNWPTMNATIVSHSVQSLHHRGLPTTWTAVWGYSYTVDGKTYLTQSNSLPGGFSTAWYQTEDEAMLNAKSRPEGSIVMAYYDPAAPLRSVLDRRRLDSNGGITAPFIVSTVIMMISVSLFSTAFAGYKKLKWLSYVAKTGDE